jgi:hypothetical protein
MKINQADFDHMRVAVLDTLNAHNLHPFMVKNERHAWDVFHKAWSEGRLNGSDLYDRYNDNHIATALKAIFKAGVR